MDEPKAHGGTNPGRVAAVAAGPAQTCSLLICHTGADIGARRGEVRMSVREHFGFRLISNVAFRVDEQQRQKMPRLLPLKEQEMYIGNSVGLLRKFRELK